MKKDLNTWKLDQLKSFAKSKGLRGFSALRKPQFIEFLIKAGVSIVDGKLFFETRPIPAPRTKKIDVIRPIPAPRTKKIDVIRPIPAPRKKD